jgi:hypothetical protein
MNETKKIGAQHLVAIILIGVIAFICQCLTHNVQYKFAILFTQIVLQVLCLTVQQMRFKKMNRERDPMYWANKIAKRANEILSAKDNKPVKPRKRW